MCWCPEILCPSRLFDILPTRFRLTAFNQVGESLPTKAVVGTTYLNPNAELGGVGPLHGRESWGRGQVREQEAALEERAEDVDDPQHVLLGQLPAPDRDYQYVWEQTKQQVTVRVPLYDNGAGALATAVKAKDVSVVAKPEKIKIVVRGEVLLEGALWAPCLCDELVWQMEVYD